jgi:hypothetical protein
MNYKDTHITTMTDLNTPNVFYLVPEKALEELFEVIKDLRKFQENLERGVENVKPLGDYIDEIQAMKVLKRGKTWFWNKRKSRELPGKNAAGRWYYKVSDLNKFIENGKSV